MRFIILVTSLCVGLFVSILDTTIVATALNDIGVHFLAAKSVTWVALAYSLAYVGFALPFASLSDVIGRRNAWAASVLLFFTFSLACGFARTLTELIASRAIQGIGGSGLYSLTMIMLPEVAPPHAQKWIGAFAGMVIATAGVVGPVVGGVITRYTTWRWIFWIKYPSGPIVVGPAILLYLFWPETTHEQQATRCSIKELDFLGALLLIAASVLVVFAFQQGGLHPTSWDTALFLAPLLVGCFLWAVLFLWEARMSHRYPDSRTAILPLRLTTRREYISVVLCTTLTGFVYFVAIFRLPLQFQIVNGLNSLEAGVDLLPLLGSVAIGSILGGLTMEHTFPALAVSTALMAIGAGLLSTLSVHTGVQNRTYGYELLLGLGTGISVSTSTVFANISTRSDDKGDLHATISTVLSN
ncbi:MFS general substrate transporter [Aureobasidium subglaciale]|nr:MFS general substrate transporter [Aureobasidium subglaciale]